MTLRTSIVGTFSGHCETVLCPVQVRCVAMWVCAQLETGPCPRPRHCCVGGHINNVLGISPHSHLISPRQLWLKIFEWNGKIIVIVCSQLAVSRVLAPGGSCLSGCSVDTSPRPPHIQIQRCSSTKWLLGAHACWLNIWYWADDPKLHLKW